MLTSKQILDGMLFDRSKITALVCETYYAPDRKDILQTDQYFFESVQDAHDFCTNQTDRLRLDLFTDSKTVQYWLDDLLAQYELDNN